MILILIFVLPRCVTLNITEAIDVTAAREAMTEEEAACLSQLYASDTIARDSCMHWEGVEVAKYWEKVGKKLLTEKLYGST